MKTVIDRLESEWHRAVWLAWAIQHARRLVGLETILGMQTLHI